MQYWIKLNGGSDLPLTKEELFSKYAGQLTSDTACAKVGENKWGKLSDYFPDWQNPADDPAEMAARTKGIPQRAIARYADAYRVADSVVSIGAFIKVLSVLVAVGSVFVGGLAGAETSSGILLYWAVLSGVCAGIPVFVVGLLVCAAGRLVKASIDTAVHSSPFLTDSEKASVMSLV